MEKSAYFTRESMGPASRRMLARVEDLRARHPIEIHPRRCALLVLDMQRYFLDESSHAFVPSAKAILPGINRLVEAFRERALPIVFTRHVNTYTDAGMMSRWWRDIIAQATPESEIALELDDTGAITLVKAQYDAFFETGLEAVLRKSVVTQVVISGVMTHLCCETTARSAFVHGFEVFFTVDGTATYNEAFHEATLLNLAHGFALPVLVDEVLAGLREG